MPRIFFSYRRVESRADMARLRVRLSQRFGAETIFVDVHDIDPGQPWHAVIVATVTKCDCLLALIGPQWEDTLTRRELTDDYVVMEIGVALRRNVLVIPVLLGGASMPVTLPSTLSGLLTRQAIEIRETSFDDDVLRLSEIIRTATARRNRHA